MSQLEFNTPNIALDIAIDTIFCWRTASQTNGAKRTVAIFGAVALSPNWEKGLLEASKIGKSKTREAS